MGFDGFPKDTLTFLAELAEPENNNKEWFAANRKRYEGVYVGPSKAFVTALGERILRFAPEINAIPKVQKGSMMRVNRDTRFSKDKRPYKDHLDLWFWQGSGKSMTCPGLGFRLRPDSVGTGGGTHGMDKDLLAAYRAAVVDDEQGGALEDLVGQINATDGYEVVGQEYKRVPRGFDPDHPRAGFLRHKYLWVNNETAIPSSFHTAAIVDEIAARFEVSYPLVKWLVAVTEPLKE